jgi:basic amino acid/polyamine antiporter, APA family
MTNMPTSQRSGTTAGESAGLLRQLGLVSATALVISNMVGTGIFTSTGFLAGPLGAPSLVLSIWVVGAICALAGAFCYSELGINFPSSGGEYVYLTQAYGPTWGFMTGWVSFFAGFSAPIATAALGFSNYLGTFFPALKQENVVYTLGSGTFSLQFGGAQACAACLIAAFTLLNFFGVRRVANVQNVLTSGKVLVLLSFIVLGLTIGKGDWGHFAMPAARTATGADGVVTPIDTPLVASFAIMLFWIYTAYSGWNAATYVAEELRNPRRTLPLALAAGTLLVAGLYVLLNVVFIYATPLESMKGVVAVGSLAAHKLFGPEVAGIFSLLMAVSLMSTVNAEVTIGPRVYYAMAKNRAFFSAAARVNPRWHTPVNAIVAQGVCAVVMALTPFQGLMFYIGFMLNFFAVLTVASLFIFRRRANWQRVPVVSFLWPLFPALFVLVGLWMTVYGMLLQWKVGLAGALTVGAGALVYHFRYKRYEVKAPASL